MPQLLPFAGLRPATAVVGPLDDVVCPPYDVITEAQRNALLQRSPYNLVRVELPAGRYQEAAILLRQWASTGALVREDARVLYGYRMSYPAPDGRTRHTLGVVGALVLEAPGQGILPHEQTTPKAKSDRLELIRATAANTSPIWCLCSEPGLADAIGGRPTTPGATAIVVDDEGNRHEIWPITDPAAHQAVARVVGAAPLLIADGHHRYETALVYQAEQAGRDHEHPHMAPGDATPAQGAPNEAGGGPNGRLGAGTDAAAGPDSVMAYVVELSEQHLEVLGIHRVVAGLPPGADVLSAFEAGFTITGATAVGAALLGEMSRAGALAIVTPAGAFLARARPGTPSAAYELDSSRVDATLRALPAHQLAYEHDVGEALAAVRSGNANAAILCRPPSVPQIAATARGGERMPPKTTFFWPKPRTGMVLRDWQAAENLSSTHLGARYS